MAIQILKQIEQVKTLIDDEKYEDAIDVLIHLKNKEDLDNYKHEVYFLLGECYTNLNDYYKAIELLNESLNSFNPEMDISLFMNIYTFLGTCYYKLNQYEKAIIYYQKIESFIYNWNNNDEIIRVYWHYKAIGNCYCELNQYEKALSNYKEIEPYLDHWNNDKDASNISWYHISIGSCYQDLKKYDKSFKEFEKANSNSNLISSKFEKDQINSTISLYLGQINSDLEKYELADSYLKKVNIDSLLESYIVSFISYFMLVKLNLFDYESIVQLYEKHKKKVSNNDDLSIMNNYIGQAYFNLGNKKKATLFFKIALEKGDVKNKEFKLVINSFLQRLKLNEKKYSKIKLLKNIIFAFSLLCFYFYFRTDLYINPNTIFHNYSHLRVLFIDLAFIFICLAIILNLWLDRYYLVYYTCKENYYKRDKKNNIIIYSLLVLILIIFEINLNF